MGGPINVDSIHWGKRTMTLRGTVWFTGHASQSFTVAYAHVGAIGLVNDDGVTLRIEVHGTSFVMAFQDASNASDAAAELQRRMEAV